MLKVLSLQIFFINVSRMPFTTDCTDISSLYAGHRVISVVTFGSYVAAGVLLRERQWN